MCYACQNYVVAEDYNVTCTDCNCRLFGCFGES